ncbi:protein of unknown function DUF329 [Syntrophotalea carbinolica DSM 2380]|uniref:Uncharacterized protein n=1 Tax=Syntrophotalea carbinolica (strain DSM 2380 / NBRC 103641 / GraBd1) TaxID=338963 RepID=Q3A419_SYNC1|nr:DNA gyrase inhibitor YacG [Syntrophotalea carbinolica]ABA88888.2 protein of unknown function DUF329 [Syntrophotalea carbinolica DSM 2380]
MTNDKKTFTVKCPHCGASKPWEGNAYRPFCSSRCRQMDLGAWVDEEYRVPDASCPSDEEQSLSELHQKTIDWS